MVIVERWCVCGWDGTWSALVSPGRMNVTVFVVVSVAVVFRFVVPVVAVMERNDDECCGSSLDVTCNGTFRRISGWTLVEIDFVGSVFFIVNGVLLIIFSL